MESRAKENLVLSGVALVLQAIALQSLPPPSTDPEVKSRRRRRYSVHPLWRTRGIEGELVLFKQLLVDNDDKFYEYFRITTDCFTTLLRKIGNQLVKKTTSMKRPIPPEERLAVCLRFLSTGDSMKTISFGFRMGHATVQNIIKETCKVIVETLLPEVMPMPSADMLENIRKEFWEKCQFPNCVGAIDGKHVTIQPPSNSGSMYFNYNKTFSIVLMALADANSNFIAVDVGTYGKTSDEGIFAQSKMGQAINGGSIRMLPDRNLPGTSICAPCVIVGSEAFPLKRNLLRPYPEDEAVGNDGRTCFNRRLSTARQVVENAFDILGQKFRLYNRRIHLHPKNVDHVVLATCALHNFIRTYERAHETHDVPTLPQLVGEGQRSTENLNDIVPLEGNATQEAVAVRDTFKDFFFAARA